MIGKALVLLLIFMVRQPALADPPEAPKGGNVIVTVTGIRDARGTIRVAVCPRSEFLKPHCRYVGQAPAQLDRVSVTIADVPFGVYAAQAFHDVNNNGVLDRNWLGMPLEGMGFSNDTPFRFGPPSFNEAAFHLSAEKTEIIFRLRYY